MKRIRAFILAIREKGDWRTLLLHTSWALTITSGMSYFVGFMRDRIFAHMFGLSRTLDIYNAAFVVPDFIFQVIVMAALSAPFLPLFTKLYDDRPERGYAYANQFICWSMVILAVTAAIVGVLMPHLTDWLVPGFNAAERAEYIFLTRAMMFSPFLFALSSFYGKMIMTFKEFFWWGLAPVAYNIGIVSGTLMFGKTYGARGIVIGTVAGVIMHTLTRYLVVRQRKYGYRHKIDFTVTPEIRETVWLTLPKIIQYGLVSLLVLEFTSIATEMGTGAVAAYNYANNFRSIPISMLGIAIAIALYPSLCHDAGKGNFKKFRRDWRRDFIRLMFYTVLAAVAMAIFATPLVKLLLGGGKFSAENVKSVATTLQLFCISIPLESLSHMYHRAYYALKNTIGPASIHSVTMIISIVLAHLWMHRFGIYAIPLGMGAGMILQIGSLAIGFPFLLRKRERKFVG